MPSCPPQKVPPACHRPQRQFDRQPRLGPPVGAISFEWPGAQSDTVWDSPTSAKQKKKKVKNKFQPEHVE